MPIPNRKEGEELNKFISRCISSIIDEYDRSQAAAICYSKSREKLSHEVEEVYVLKPKKSENRGLYLTRCMKNNKMRLQFPSMKERGAFCLSSFNEFYKYWQKQEDFGDIPKDSALGQCIAREKAKGANYKIAYAVCSTKVVSPNTTINLEEDDDDLLIEPVIDL